MSFWICQNCHATQGFANSMKCFACEGPLEMATFHPSVGASARAIAPQEQIDLEPLKSLAQTHRFPKDPFAESLSAAIFTLIREVERSRAPQPHRCAGCDLRWEDLPGAELCGDCWRKAQPVVHGAARAIAPQDELLIAQLRASADVLDGYDKHNDMGLSMTCSYASDAMHAAANRLEARVIAQQDNMQPNPIDTLRLKLVRHMSQYEDPCEDRGVEWPCDVARAFRELDEELAGQAARAIALATPEQEKPIQWPRIKSEEL
jgi:hypothetical protein